MIKQNQNFKQRVKTCNLIAIFSVEKWKILQNILPLKKVQLGIIFTSDTNEQTKSYNYNFLETNKERDCDIFKVLRLCIQFFYIVGYVKISAYSKVDTMY